MSNTASPDIRTSSSGKPQRFNPGLAYRVLGKALVPRVLVLTKALARAQQQARARADLQYPTILAGVAGLDLKLHLHDRHFLWTILDHHYLTVQTSKVCLPYPD